MSLSTPHPDTVTSDPRRVPAGRDHRSMSLESEGQRDESFTAKAMHAASRAARRVSLTLFGDNSPPTLNPKL